MKRLAVKLKPAAEKAVKQGHPWIWESGIEKIAADTEAGDQVIVFDKKKNKFLAFGLYDPYSPIKIKVLQVGQPMKLDAEWLHEKLEDAIVKRQPLLETDTNSFRWVYGENDFLPSLILDVYDNVGVLKIYSTIWLPYLETIITCISDNKDLSAIVLRMSRNTAKEVKEHDMYYDGAVVFGTLRSSEIIFKEYGLRFTADVVHGHKTGYFLDHRHNRHRVSRLSKGKRVLDVFSYAGGFSVHALAGGAKEVTSLDISKQALEMARKNVALNKLTANHKVIAGDAFEVMDELYQKGKRYDLIIVDPPSFAKKAEETERALKSYRRLAGAALKLVSKGGMLLMASCSSRVNKDQFFEAVESTFNEKNVSYEIVDKTVHDIDHPIRIPEAAYLKCGYYLIH